MFKVKNMLPGVFPLTLERGATNLRPGQIFDLDRVCTREWIRTDPELKSLIDKGLFSVVFDSETSGLPKIDMTSTPRKVEPPAPTPRQEMAGNLTSQSISGPVEVEILSAPRPIQKPKTIKKPTPPPQIYTVEAEKDTFVALDDPDTGTSEDLKIEASPEPSEDSGVQYKKPELKRMKVTMLQGIAEKLGIDIDGKFKRDLVGEILDKQ